jgi:hypothetical protein
VTLPRHLRTSRTRALLLGPVVALICLLTLVPASQAADPTAPAATPGATDAAAESNPLRASLSLGLGRPGDNVTVTGSGWPGGVTIQTSTCGNNAIKGASDCNALGAGNTVTRPDGSFSLDMRIAKPPVPCPCVVHVVSPNTTVKVDQFFDVQGHPTAPIDLTVTVRSLTVESQLTGAGPVTAWLGGAAKRTLALTVKNTGSTAVTDPSVTVTGGTSADPTTLIASPKIGTVPAGGTLEYRMPITIPAWTFGSYTVKSYFGDLDTAVTTTASTTTYPWLLLVLLWLAIQPLLLGLYRRRPVVETGGDDDPLWFPAGPSGSPSPAATAAAASAANGFANDDPLFGGLMPAAAVAAVGTYAAVTPQPAAVPVAVPNGYHPVFGVTDLRGYLDPDAVTPPYIVAPRIVLGGLAPDPNRVNGNGSTDQ